MQTYSCSDSGDERRLTEGHGGRNAIDVGYHCGHGGFWGLESDSIVCVCAVPKLEEGRDTHTQVEDSMRFNRLRVRVRTGTKAWICMERYSLF